MFLGWLYRELRAALVDMREYFETLRTTTSIKDGSKPLPATPPASAYSATAVGGLASAGNNGVNNGVKHESAHASMHAASHAMPPVHLQSETPHSLNGVTNGASTSSRSTGVTHGSQELTHGPASDAAGRQAGAASSSGRGLLVELKDVHFGYSKDREVGL